MKHLILTRFNLQYDANSHIGIQPEWLIKRFDLFESYCLPSIQAQTIKDFRWILFCDSDTPDAYKQRLENYKSILPQIDIVYSPWMEDFNKLYHRISLNYVTADELLLTTRLDNDDALAPAYVETVQNIAKECSYGIITFPTGRQTFVNDRRSFRIHYKCNHFTSRIEHSGYFTALGLDHTMLSTDDIPVHEIVTDEPMWEEFVHGGNIANTYQPRYRHHITSVSDAAYIIRCWCVFQAKHVIRLCKRLFVAANK